MKKKPINKKHTLKQALSNCACKKLVLLYFIGMLLAGGMYLYTENVLKTKENPRMEKYLSKYE